MKLIRKINHLGFTLFELMLGMAIFAMIMTSVLESVGNITIARTKTMNRITLLEELYFFSEKLASSIKDGGIIDYEEYWNRQVVGTTTATGHYLVSTGFGNYGSGGTLGANTYGKGYYYCRSGDIGGGGTRAGTGGCLTNNNSDKFGALSNTNYSGAYQRYGEYKLQYSDYNGNADSDTPGVLGDEDNDASGSIIGDEDDKDIGDGPSVLSGATPELYLINPITYERTYFRWTYTDDPGLPGGTCIYTGVNAGSGCLGNIEVLKLQGKDLGITSHTGGVYDSTAFDGNIDTWLCHPDWPCSGPVIASYGILPKGVDSEWVKIFPDYVNVKKISFTLYPQKDPWKSWAAPDDLSGTPGFVSPFIQPYVQVQLTMGLAWSKRSLIRGDDPTISISTTISLTGESQ